MARVRKKYYENALVHPIHQTATYYFESTEQVVGYHQGTEKLGRYARYDNPSWLSVEEKLAALDGAEQALLFPSGMNAIVSTLLTFLSAGDKLIFTGKGYRNIRQFCFDILGRLDISVKTLPLLSQQSVYDILSEENTNNLKVVFIESPSNPHMFLVEIERVRQIVGDSCLIIVDSTFSTPINFQPLCFGADLVIHSCGKYIGGHADIMAGSVTGRVERINSIRRTRNVMGGITDPHAAFLLDRSLSTLRMRMEHLNMVGQKFAEYLVNDNRIGKVYYTGVPEHPQYKLGQKYLSGHGGVVTFEVAADKEAVSQVIDQIKVPYMGTNFGSSYSMIEQLSIFTYYNQSEKEKKDLGITDNLIRYSIGFDDDIDHIISDLDSALNLSSL